MIQGNIFDCTQDIIVHQTNCLGVMGTGLALQVKQKYPKVFNAYYHYCKTTQAKDLLGTTLICEADDGKYIANLFGQFNYGDGLQTDYDSFKTALQEIHDFAKENGLSVALPYKIGCGLGGGDWDVILDIITQIFNDNVQMEIYQYETT
jgi:O-acetyl-ADP-ribose deacetylase (regulator of RNase III)